MSKEKKFQVGDRVQWKQRGCSTGINVTVKTLAEATQFDYCVGVENYRYFTYEDELTLELATAVDWDMNIRHYHESNDPYGHMRKHNGRVKKFATWVTMTHKRTHHAVIGRSFCSWKDQPNKKTGVRIAKERAHEMVDQLV